MFCSDCGEKAAGKFCWSCGSPLVPAENQHDLSDDNHITPTDWKGLINYDVLIGIAEVRDRIARHASQSKRKMTAEEFLERCDKMMTPLTGGVPLTFIANLAQPLGEKMGLKSGQTRSERLAERPGSVLVAVLCSLAKNGNKLGEVKQFSDGCTLRANVPSDVWTFKGELLVTVQAAGDTTLIDAGLTIPGQLYDWGKSRRALDELFADVASLAKAA